jgi:hypothetical protein
MLRTSACGGTTRGPTNQPEQRGFISVGPVSLLGVHVVASVAMNHNEHERRDVLGLGPVNDPALLGRLLDFRPDEEVNDPVLWAETVGLPAGIVERGDDGYAVTPRLQPPLIVCSIIVQGQEGRELLAVQNASLFAGFAARWVSLQCRDVTDVAMMEAVLCGVGLIGPRGDVLLEAQGPESQVADEWSWLLQEKIYGRWLREQARAHARESQVPTTGEANATAAC